MSTEYVGEQPKSGMSTRKKWLIGCGGCLGLLALIGIMITVLVSMGWNTLQKVSGDSVKDIFGKSYDTSGYTALGLPLGEQVRMAMLIAADQSSIIMAMETKAKPADYEKLMSSKPEVIQQYFEGMSEQFLAQSSQGSSSAKIEELKLEALHFGKLPAGKQYPIIYATAKTQSKGQIAYMPAVVVVIPEAQNKVVSLISTAPKSTTEDSAADFKADQKALETELDRVIRDSELDDRLVTEKSAAKH